MRQAADNDRQGREYRRALPRRRTPEDGREPPRPAPGRDEDRPQMGPLAALRRLLRLQGEQAPDRPGLRSPRRPEQLRDATYPERQARAPARGSRGRSPRRGGGRVSAVIQPWLTNSKVINRVFPTVF